MTFCRRLLVEIRLPAAREPGTAMGELVELDDGRHRPSKERTVVADEQDGCLKRRDPPLEAVETVEVEIVGRLVEQIHVEARQQQGGESDPRRLASRQRRGRLVEQAVGESELRPHAADARRQVGDTERQPALQGVVVAVLGIDLAIGEGGRRRIELSGRSGRPGAPIEKGGNQFDTVTARLLGQEPDRRGGWRQFDGAAVGLDATGQHTEQRRLADPVRSDEADGLVVGDGQVDRVEDDVRATGHGDAARSERGGRRHPVSVAAGVDRCALGLLELRTSPAGP